MQTISINEKFTLQWVETVQTYERTIKLLVLKGIKYNCEDVTKERMGHDYPVAIGRPEVVFTIDGVTIKRAEQIRELVSQ